VATVLPRNVVIGKAHVTGNLSRRQTLDPGWNEVEEGRPIYLHDLLYTPKGSSAQIHFGKGKVLELSSDTLVHVDEMEPDRLMVSLYQGKVQGDVAAVETDTFVWAIAPKQVIKEARKSK
jgi:hypothetical protein